MTEFKDSKGYKAVFLDRDGTIIGDGGYNYKPEELVLIPGAIEALKRLKHAGYLLIVVTSQSGIARGYYTEEDYHKFNSHFLKHTGEFVDDVYYCPHHKEGKPPHNIECNCRKPKTGMIEQAVKKWHINLSASWVVGDKTSDVKLGENAGCNTILVETGKAGNDAAYSVNPTYKAKDLLDAAEHILKNE
ncbi:HAD family hydrolase [Candidatus Woesearchaeota archaeon]|nr:HAD family hydrolase [Candidatus Woesearchaeota archaeon]